MRLQSAFGEVSLGAAGHRAAEIRRHLQLVPLTVVNLELPLCLKSLITLVTREGKLSLVQLQVGVEVVHSGEGPVAAAHVADEGLALDVALLVTQQLGAGHEGPVTAGLRTGEGPDVVMTQDVQLQLVTLPVRLPAPGLWAAPELLTGGDLDPDDGVDLDPVLQQRRLETILVIWTPQLVIRQHSEGLE